MSMALHPNQIRFISVRQIETLTVYNLYFCIFFQKFSNATEPNINIKDQKAMKSPIEASMENGEAGDPLMEKEKMAEKEKMIESSKV